MELTNDYEALVDAVATALGVDAGMIGENRMHEAKTKAREIVEDWISEARADAAGY